VTKMTTPFQVQIFLESVKNDCVGEPKITDQDISIILKPETMANRQRFDEINRKARALGGTIRISPRPRFLIPLSKPSPAMLEYSGMPVAKSTIVHQTYEDTLTILYRFLDGDMTPLSSTDKLRLPKSVLDLIELLKPNAKGLYDLNGNIFIEMNIAVLQSIETFEAFLLFYRSVIAKFPGLQRYSGLYEKTKDDPDSHKTVTTNLYAKVAVMDLILEKLIYFFSSDSEFPVTDGINFLLSHGISDADLQKELKVPYRTYHRYKTENNASAKVATPEITPLEPPKQQTTALAILPS